MGGRAGINTSMQNLLNSESYLTGSTQAHLVEWIDSRPQSDRGNLLSEPFLVHRDVAEPLTDLRQLAAKEGFDLRLCSSFRSFDRQLKIWNDKLNGLRPVYDDNGVQLDLTQLSDWQQVQAVMRWSALPGASRHHWGTDFDIYDAAAVESNYQVQLSPDEVSSGGVFAAMHNWLDTLFEAGCSLEGGDNSSFYRPYAEDRGGIAPERWHISYRPLAERYAAQLSVDLLARRLCNVEIVHRDIILERLDELYQRFIEVAH